MTRKKRIITKLETMTHCPSCGYIKSIIINKICTSYYCKHCECMFWIEVQVKSTPLLTTNRDGKIIKEYTDISPSIV